MSDTQVDANAPSEPFHWIQLELLPLPHAQEAFSKLLVWWNPDDREIVGESAEVVLKMIEEAKHKGASGPHESVELSDPLGKPTELAAILGQYFWVIPQPVRSPGEYVAPDEQDSELDAAHSVQ